MANYLTWEYPGLSFVRLLSRLNRSVIRLPMVSFADVVGETGRQRTGDQAAVNEQAERMLNNYGNAVLRLAYSYLHNMADAEEVLQDALTQFLKTAPILETEEHEKAWLLHVAANMSKNRIKYNAVRQTDELMEELAAEERDDLSFVWEAVKALPEKYREVIHLFYHEGYQTVQIAKILGMKETTVRSNLARGREKLKAVLKEAYDFE
ncbi:MAG: sigma-70 family RNA polymerase sigma factor [Blautia sp.]|nr:sigma-70 family RNA polymerase sigma factor [Muribaculaceae bacterium]MCM1543128.1 sigma-70 family RNA polymerase sigma factor [Blautia sp.]